MGRLGFPQPGLGGSRHFFVSTGSWRWACRWLVRMCRAWSPASAGTACGRGGLEGPSEFFTPRKVLTVILAPVWAFSKHAKGLLGRFFGYPFVGGADTKKTV